MGSPDSSKVRPLISTRDRAGAGSSTADFVDQGTDLTFIPGYSDRRQRIDSELSQGRMPGERLTHRMQWVTVTKADGKTADLRKVVQFRAKGYRYATWDELPNLTNDAQPIQAFKNAEGNVQVGDAVLMVCDARTAARNEAQGRSAIDDQTSNEASGVELRKAAHDLGAVGHGTVTDDLNWTKQSVGPQPG